MLIDLEQLKKDIEEYPGKLQAALLKQGELEDRATVLLESIALESGDEPLPRRRQSLMARQSAYALLREDNELVTLKRDMERLRRTKLVAISRDPAAYELRPNATQKVIDAAVSQDADVVTLQRKIEEREDLLREKAEELERGAAVQNMVGVDLNASEELELKQRETRECAKGLA